MNKRQIKKHLKASASPIEWKKIANIKDGTFRIKGMTRTNWAQYRCDVKDDKITTPYKLVQDLIERDYGNNRIVFDKDTQTYIRIPYTVETSADYIPDVSLQSVHRYKDLLPRGDSNQSIDDRYPAKKRKMSKKQKAAFEAERLRRLEAKEAKNASPALVSIDDAIDSEGSDIKIAA